MMQEAYLKCFYQECPLQSVLWSIILILIIYFFYKQPVYKQLALGWETATQFSGLNPLSLSNNKNNRLKKSGVFHL